MRVVPVLVHDGTDDQARMWEISENLHRADLTALERSEHIAEWVKLAGDDRVAQHAPPGGRQPREKGINAAVRDLGIDRTDAQRSVKISKLAPKPKGASQLLS